MAQFDARQTGDQEIASSITARSGYILSKSSGFPGCRILRLSTLRLPKLWFGPAENNMHIPQYPQ